MNVLSVCSGIGTDALAGHSLGWRTLAFAETATFPSAVLAHHYPQIPNLGDINEHRRWDVGRPDVLVGGTPCQSFSVSGQRRGMDDARGQLSQQFVRIAKRLSPAWVVWENVPGVLSADRGAAFGQFISGLEKCGYGVAWRMVDALGWLPQRRKRIFVVGHLGDWRPPVAVLFEPSRRAGDAEEDGEERGGNGCGTEGGTGENCGTRIDGNRLFRHSDWHTPQHASAHASTLGAVTHLSRSTADTVYVPHGHDNRIDQCHGASRSLTARMGTGGCNVPFVAAPMLRYLTPMECERLMGIPDGYTAIPWRGRPAEQCPKSFRYQAIGNAIAVPCLRWIGRRMAAVAEMMEGKSDDDSSMVSKKL